MTESKNLSRSRARNALIKEAKEVYGVTFAENVEAQAVSVSLLRRSIGFRSHKSYNVWLCECSKEINGSPEKLIAIKDMATGNITVTQEENFAAPPVPIGDSFYFEKQTFNKVEKNGNIRYVPKNNLKTTSQSC